MGRGFNPPVGTGLAQAQAPRPEIFGIVTKSQYSNQYSNSES